MRSSSRFISTKTASIAAYSALKKRKPYDSRAFHMIDLRIYWENWDFFFPPPFMVDIASVSRNPRRCE
jgi:hypothetical protein